MTQLASKEIRIIGPRASGKTTYLAALLRIPNELKKQFHGLQVTALTECGEKLVNQATNIIEKGAKIAGTDIGNEPEFHFSIVIPTSKRNSTISLELVAKDYSGEIFEMAAQSHHSSVLEPYFNDWFNAGGLMIMMTDWQTENDERVYAPAILKILSELADRAKVKPVLKDFRIAIVMTKCERGEIWPCRNDPEEDLFRVRLPKTYALLKKQTKTACRFFACSTFGVMSDKPGDRDPRPNRYIPSDGSSSEFNAFLRDKDAWKPYGLISPIYWLTTGKVFYNECL
jgi:Double-GTPase 1